MGGGEKIRPVFLLGGYDLEMTTIRDLLLVHGYRVEDRRLEWGARLSAYADILNNTDTFAGIELIEDIPLPDHYIAIDHHNLNSGKPSSLEQVANLTGVSLNRYQQLVAANDCGYIPALQNAGASPQEIDEIRKADRKAQGVTEEDEILAQRSIETRLTKAGNLIVIESLTPKFSCITDRLFPFNRLLIGFENHFVYYGEGAQELIETYNALIAEKKAYYGGTGNGFFGLDKNSFDAFEAGKLKQEIIQKMSQS